MGERSERLQVFARLKPLPDNAYGLGYDIQPCTTSDLNSFLHLFVDDGTKEESVSYEFPFHGVFSPRARQEEVFSSVAEPVILSFIEGFNGCVFCYGQTGSGKTYTTAGSSSFDSRGIIPRSVSLVFQEGRKVAMRANISVQFTVSFLEIYNEVGYDLLADKVDIRTSLDDWPRVSVHEDNAGCLTLKNLNKKSVMTEGEALDYFMMGNNHRMVSATPMNTASSRSHCVFTIEMETRDSMTSVITHSKLHIIDLAGSERAWKSGLSDQVLSEAKYINRSLHFLEQVISALKRNEVKKRHFLLAKLKTDSFELLNRSVHVPYRNSLLTSVLRDSLGGNCKTVMVANLSLERSCLNETIATSRFAQRCSQLTNNLHVNEAIDYRELTEKLREENRLLSNKLFTLQQLGNTPNNLGTILEEQEDINDEQDSRHVNIKLSDLVQKQKPPMEASIGTMQQFLPLLKEDCKRMWTVRQILEETKTNLVYLPREVRKVLLTDLRQNGLDVQLSSVSELCGMVQVLLGKLNQLTEEKSLNWYVCSYSLLTTQINIIISSSFSY